MKFRSIQAKILLALLAVSLLPLLLFVAIARSGMVDVREYVKAELITAAQDSLLQLTGDQATIADAMLNQIESETNMVAHLASMLLHGQSALDYGQPAGAAHNTDAPPAVFGYTLAPDISLAAATPELERYRALEQGFGFIRSGNPNLDALYFGTASGIFLEYPWLADAQASLEFSLDAAFAAQLNQGGMIGTPLWEAFRQQGAGLSRQSRVSTQAPDRMWLIQDLETERIFSVRRTANGLDVYWEFDPRIRLWYRAAASQTSVVWSKYADWSRGEHLFTLDAEPALAIGDRVTAALARAFARRHVALSEGSPLTRDKRGNWRVQDRNGKNYEIRDQEGGLNVYGIDILTCSRAVRTPQGTLAGVVGLDISMAAISRRLIHTPEMTPGHAFLLNERGDLIEQERADMFIPEAGGDVRRKMTAGDAGITYDAASATYVAYAPIRTIHSAAEDSFWSVGISMPQGEITRLADDIQRRMDVVFNLLVGILAAMLLVVVYAAVRLARGITGPILELDAGATRIGGGDLDHILTAKSGDEIGQLANTFNKMAADLKDYIRDLKETTAEKERFASELRVAHEIQMSFLKKIFPPYPNRSDICLFATLEPAREVGGDLYDFALLDESRLVFYIGDVSDKGVPASLVMAMTMTLMKRATQQPGITPAGILRQVNRALAEDNVNAMFVTLFIGILNVRTGELCFSNAGHNPPLIRSADGQCRYLQLPDGLVLGVMTDAEYSDDSVQLGAGDMLVTYTDGVTEAMNPHRVLYSEERLQETLAALAGCGVEDTVAEIIASVRKHADGAPQSDDIAVLVVQRP
jgi:serine phosphatase RsbU (regulator of sigma subunit)/HAMP domain-containing protein